MSTPSISNLRRRAKRLGLRFFMSNWRKETIDNCGGYQVVDVSRNFVVDGARFDCSLDDVAEIIRLQEAA